MQREREGAEVLLPVAVFTSGARLLQIRGGHRADVLRVGGRQKRRSFVHAVRGHDSSGGFRAGVKEATLMVVVVVWWVTAFPRHGGEASESGELLAARCSLLLLKQRGRRSGGGGALCCDRGVGGVLGTQEGYPDLLATLQPPHLLTACFF